TRLPLVLLRARLACVKPAASVRSEPGSNSQVENLIYGYYQSHHCVKHRTQTSGHAQIDENIFTHQTIIADHPGNIVLIQETCPPKFIATVRSLEPSADYAAHVSLSSV